MPSALWSRMDSDVFIIHQLENKRSENDSNDIFSLSLCCGADFAILLYLKNYIAIIIVLDVNGP